MPWLTPAQIAEELVISERLVLKLCLSGELRSSPVSGGSRKTRRIKREWLDDYLSQCERQDRAARKSLVPPPRSRRRARNLLHV